LAEIQKMPPIALPEDTLADWGELWLGNTAGIPGEGVADDDAPPPTKAPERFNKRQGMEFGRVFDFAFGIALAEMLGGIAVVSPRARSLTPPQPDCVEVGTTRVIGGIRPQNYDAAYRPDGPRIVFDSKTLNDEASIRKNWQNMVNDLASEAATAHIRFPFCIVAFIIALPAVAFHALSQRQRRAITTTLERLGSRKDELDQHHLAEAIALVIWDPRTGQLDTEAPPPDSAISLNSMPDRIYASYADRYQHLPPHTT